MWIVGVECLSVLQTVKAFGLKEGILEKYLDFWNVVPSAIISLLLPQVQSFK